MPPLVPRKRLKSDSPTPEPRPKRAARSGRESVFQTLDTPPTFSRTLSQTRALLEQEDDDSSLSSLESSDEEFEHVISNETPTLSTKQGKKAQDESSADEDWEDALGADNEPIITDIQIDISSVPTQSAFASGPAGKKGPSKIQRQIRYLTHRLHVQLLIFHNMTRNAWIQDQVVQKTLVESLNVGCWKEIQRYWRDSRISDGPDRLVAGAWSEKIAKQLGLTVKEHAPSPGAGKKGNTPGKNAVTGQKQRDWSTASELQEPNTPNLSAGDPLLRLLRYLSSYWKSKFIISAPCLRKRGYLDPEVLGAEINAWKQDPSDAKHFGERFQDIDDFRETARKCEGSRDVGQQLFTALLRGLGFEARMVASLQPIGFGWSQAEEGKPHNLEKSGGTKTLSGKTTSKTSPVKPPTTTQAVDGTRTVPINLSDDDSSGLSSLDFSDSGIDRSPTKISTKPRRYGEDLPYPTYWTEVISHLTHTPVCVSPLPRPIIATSSSPDALSGFYCRGAAADKAKQVFAYIVAFSSDSTAKDVTTRYLPQNQWPGKTKGFRMPVEKIPVYNKHGKVKRYEEWDWFKSVLRSYARSHSKRQPWDEIEDETDLVPRKPVKPKHMDEVGGKETLQGYKESADYVLERHLRREEALRPGAKIVRYFTTGKGDKEKKEPVYYRKDVVATKSVESWHKEGRAVKAGEQPLKFVPMRAVTIIRKREIEEREREEGEKVKQGLYSWDQTEWIIPDPIENGRIPRNAFGNIDIYVPTMVPRGAVHIPKKGTARICKKLGIDFAEACTGFEFGKQRAVPVLTGVVVAREHKDVVIDAWKAAEAERIKKEQAKKETVVLGMWKKFVVGLRIVDRMKKEYGDDEQLPTPPGKKTTSKKSQWEVFQEHGDDFEGGFVREDADPRLAGGFVRDDDTAMSDTFHASQASPTPNNMTLTIDHGDDDQAHSTDSPAETTSQTPISLTSAVAKKQEEASTEENGSVTLRENDRDPAPPVIQQQMRAKKASALGAKRTRKRQLGVEDLDDDPSGCGPSSTSTSNSDGEVKSRPTTRGKPKLVQHRTPTRTLPRRKAAIQSDARVRSHYFGNRSDDDMS